MNHNEHLIQLAEARDAPAYLIDFMRAYPNYVPTINCFITTAYQRYTAQENNNE